MISFIYPICNRTDLFKATLSTFLEQTLPTDEYEILVIDDNGTCPRLIPLLTTFREHGLPIRYYRVDITKLSDKYKIFQHAGLLNDPGPAMNVGIRKAQYDRVVLSSPEVFH